jgi:hypothetical protein
MQLQFESISDMAQRWVHDALALSVVKFDMLLDFTVTVAEVAEPSCPGHQDYMCAQITAGSGRIEIRSTATDPESVNLPPGESVRTFFIESVIHEFAHLLIMSKGDSAFAGHFNRATSVLGVAGTRGTAADWNPLDKPWDERIAEAAAEVVKDAALGHSQRVFDNRTKWDITPAEFSNFMDALIPRSASTEEVPENHYNGTPVALRYFDEDEWNAGSSASATTRVTPHADGWSGLNRMYEIPADAQYGQVATVDLDAIMAAAGFPRKPSNFVHPRDGRSYWRGQGYVEVEYVVLESREFDVVAHASGTSPGIWEVTPSVDAPLERHSFSLTDVQFWHYNWYWVQQGITPERDGPFPGHDGEGRVHQKVAGGEAPSQLSLSIISQDGMGYLDAGPVSFRFVPWLWEVGDPPIPRPPFPYDDRLQANQDAVAVHRFGRNR